ncbi:hypothetical protein [Paraburkholderia sediminicola]|uniref:hypothetical protein n=1 Tax=Paraburkholderia sediminicola TaxID=458836 RepID=UPI0038B79773
MSTATEEFLLGMAGLEAAASKIASPTMGYASTRSAEYLQLNGLHVVSFSLLEDFLRRRTLEVLTSIGKANVKFEYFPDNMKLHLLQETFKGINFYLGRKTTENKLDTLLIDILSINTAADENLAYMPSEFSFGRSQSNISLTQVVAFLESFGVSVSATFSSLIARLRYEHLGSPEGIFSRLAENRNMAAHAFNLNFNLVEFINDVKIAFKVLAFVYDTSLSHSLFQIKQAAIKGEPIKDFNADTICLKSVRYDSLKGEWQVMRQIGENEDQQKPIKEKNLHAKLDAFRNGKHDKEDTVYVINSAGALQTWIQPI